MGWQFTPMAALYMIAVLFSFILAVLAWRQRPSRGAVPLTLLTASGGVWSLGYLLGFFSTSLPFKLAMVRVEYIGIAATPVLWMVFVLAYTHYHRYLSTTTVILLSIIPAGTLIFNITNAWHELFYQSYGFTTAPNGLLVSTKVYGPYFWLHVGYSYTLVTVASILLILSVVRYPGLYRRQVTPLILAGLTPLIVNVTYITGLNPFEVYDTSSLAFLIAGGLVLYSMVRFKLLDIVPVAHDRVIRQMNDGVLIVDDQGRIVEINPMAETILNTQSSDVLGQPLTTVMNGHSQLVHSATDDLNAEVNIAEHVYELHISPITNRAEKVQGRLLMLHDVTARKQAERFLAEARDQAEEASRQKSAFLANMSHELRTPLNAILGYTELMMTGVFGEITPQQADRLKRVHTNGQNLLSLIDNVLDLSKIEADRMQVERVVFNGDAFLADITTTIESLIKANGNRFIIETPDSIGGFATDRTKLRQILLNLLSNAAKFTHDGTITLRVTIGTADCEGCVRFAVQDTGIGMSPEAQQRVFESFTQADISTTRQFGGTGLGLTISRHYCQLLGGDLTVDSQQGVGTTFTATIPRTYDYTLGDAHDL